MTKETKPHDWEAIETAYRAGVLSLRQIGTEHGISDTAIRKRAKRDGWVRDLAAKVRSKADDLVRREAVRKAVRAQTATEKEIIDANANDQANVHLTERRDIQKARTLVMQLLTELEQTTGNADVLEQLGDLMRNPDSNTAQLETKMLEVYRKVISLPSRVDSMRKLADALKTLIALEREAFGIDTRKSPGQTLDEFLDSLAEAVA